MKSRIVMTLAGMLLAATVSATAEAQIRLDRPVGGSPSQPAAPSGDTLDSITPAQLLGLLSKVGYGKGQMLDMKRTDVQGFRADVNGTTVVVLLAGCEAKGCSNIQYATFFGKQTVSADFINGFNRDKRWGKLYIDSDGDLAMTMDIPLYGGVTPAYIGVSGAIYVNTLKELFGYKP